MARCLKFLNISLIFCLLLFLCCDFCFSCFLENSQRKYDLTSLDWPNWQVVGKKNGSDIVMYDISLCKPLNYSASPAREACANSSVCRHSGGISTEMARFTPLSNMSVYDGVLKGGFMLFLTASSCSSELGSDYHTIINFVCGPTLGSPELFMESECRVHLFWKTSAACKNPPKYHGVPCYVIDKEGNKRNLESLVWYKPTFVLPTYGNQNGSIFISVCSDINVYPLPSCKNCPPRTSAVRVSKNGKSHPIGLLTSGLELTEEGLKLTYGPPILDLALPDGCDVQPTTTVLFRCPERLKNRRPRLISDIDCQYEIEWETEYACPQSMLKGDFKTCKFTKKVHGIDVDLSPLRKDKGFYEVNGTRVADKRVFSFNICGGLGEDFVCNGTTWASNAVCVKYQNSSEVIGLTSHASLMLAEQDLSLTYDGPECYEGRQQLTVINFVCDSYAKNDDIGYPVHFSSDNCTNVFFWETKYACLPDKPDIPCSISDEGKFFLLSRLRKTSGNVWNVLSPRGKNTDSHSLYYMNVCGPVDGFMNDNFTKCEGDPAVSRIDGIDNCVNLGEFVSSPSYDPTTQSVKIEYKNGSICNRNLRWSSVVEFKCYPGLFTSDVILTHVNEVGCVNEFEFRSAVACPLTSLVGRDCRIIDSQTGVNIDLSPLNSSSYEVTGPEHTFYLSVCRSLPNNNTCLKLLNSSHDVAACAVSLNQSDPKPQNLGAPSSQVNYVYGNVNLKYVSDPSGDNNNTSFRTIILFMCSIHAGNGAPVFSKASRGAYIFHWYTSLICPQPLTTECLVSDPKTGRQYDFSGLSKSKDNWVAYFNEQREGKIVKRKLYLNICRSLNPAPSCDPDSAACIVTIEGEKETKYLSNVGRATSNPQLSSDDHLQLHYTHGKSCTAHGENINYSTIVHFMCSDHDMNGPRFLGKVGECQYTFLWTTKAACPSEIISVENECMLTDPETGFTFDLTSLSDGENSYNISAKGRTYKLNICNPVVSGCTNDSVPKSNISVCEVSKDGKITVLGTTKNFTLQYNKGRDLILAYQNEANDSKEDQSSEVVVTFPCDNTTSKALLNFIEKKDQRYYFEVKTPLTCIQEVSDCTILDDKGNEYDLTQLFQSTRNWEVPDHRYSYSGIRYHISFCRPLVKVPGYKCPGGATGACQTNLTSPQNLGFSLGSQVSVPTISEDGTIVVHFSDGDECRLGLRRSARVNLFCSHSQGELVFLGETSECEYLFSMHTPAACSLQTAIGKDCVVHDPVFEHTFNLNSLKNKHASAVDGKYEYFISVCEKLGFSGACENSSVCQTKPDDPKFSKSLGLPNADLMYSQGILTLSYNDGSVCHDKYNRTTIIKFTCKHPTDNDEEKPYFISEAEDCTYLFEWPTKLACPPFEVSECSAVDDNGLLYDLSDLSMTSDNYYVRNPMSHNQTFIINVCRSVVYSPDSLCPYASASCLLDPSNASPEKRRLNIGQVTRPPYFENGKLMMKYSAGSPCDVESGSSARFMETIIEFICDKQKISSEPEFIGRDICTYYFTWSTVYACTVSEPENYDCLATDPYTGFEFDFSPLKKDHPYEIQTADHKYFLNVCGDVKTSPCGGKSGVCQQELRGKKRSWNAGNANSKLLYQGGVLMLNYSDGASCHNNAYKRNTIIQFECSAGPGNPHFLYESSDCTYYFTWGTEFACQSLVHCAVKNGSHFFDLTPLTVYPYHSAESHLDNDSASYYISVCSSLNHVPGLSCPAGSAICRSDRDSAVSVSLGRVEYPPFIDFEGHATILYTNGSKCLNYPNEQYRSRIIFKCDRDADMGYPMLVRREDDICYHIFEWRTNLICPLEPTDTSQTSGCYFADNSTGIHFDLSGLKKTGSHYEVVGDKGDMFLLNICGEVADTGCSKSAVCLQNSDKIMSSFGTASSQKLSYDGNRLRATFTDGDDCIFSETGKRSAEIIFVCDPENGLGKPKLHKKYSCLTVFMWETNLVCQDIQHPCSFSIGKKNYDIHLLSSLSHNWKTTDSENNTYYLNLCRGLYSKDAETKGCPSNAAVCMKQDNSVMSLGLVHTMTKSLNDNGELVLTYTSGSTGACSSVESHVQPLTAMSKITLKCGKSWGSPKITSGPDNSCSFNFDWSTSLACEVKNEDLVYESNGTLIDNRLGYEMDLTDILNRTFKVFGSSEGDNYMYVINIGQGYQDAVDVDRACSVAAVCQTKPKTHFYRDIGSINSRRFSLKGSELHLSLTSHTKGCGKNQDRNVTTLFIMVCTSYAGDGIPEFIYESGGCDYIFNWDTNAVCPVVHRRDKPITDSPPTAPQDNSPEAQVSTSYSHAPAVIMAVLCIVLILCPVVYIVSKKERRSAAGAKIRSIFHQVTLPHFRYRRGEMLTELQSDF